MITIKPLEKSRFFRISCAKVTNAKNSNILFIIDGKSFVITMCPGNNVIVQGKSIYLEQTETEESGSIGQWEIIQEPLVEYENSGWAFYPDASKENIVASFEEEHEFVLYFDFTSECNDDTMHIIIDGREVKDIKGKALSLLSGSSITGKGKCIAITISGASTLAQPFTGGIKIRKNIYPSNKSL